MKKMALLLLILTQLCTAIVTEWILENPTLNLNSDTIIINDAYNYANIPDDGVLKYMISHAVGHKNFRAFDGWEPGIWTGLHNSTEKWGLTDSNNVVSYGTTAVQTKDTSVGMHLNTYGNPPVVSSNGTRITDIEAAQIVASWSEKDLWNTKPNDDLCIQSELDIHSVDVQSGATSQVMYTIIFKSKDTYITGEDGISRDLNFFFNALVYDNHQNLDERIIRDPETHMPIVMTRAKSEYNTDDTYSTGILGLYTQQFTKGTPPSGFKNFGICITKTQMETMIRNLKNKFSDYNLPNFNISNLRLHRVIPALELATNNATKNGRIGVTFKNIQVYRSRVSSSWGRILQLAINIIKQAIWDITEKSVHRNNSLAKYYTFSLSKPTKVTIDLSSDLDTYMYLLSGKGVSGNILAEDDNGGTGTNSQITKILPAGTYTVEATAHATNDVTPLSIKVNTYDIPITPSKPTDIQTSSITTNSAVLNWNDTSNNELGFKIYQGSTYVTTVTANTTSYTLTNLDDNTHYTYTIISYNDGGDSESSTISFTTPLAKPFMPSNLKVSNIDTTSATLTWQDNADNESGFRLYKNNVLIATLAPNTTTYKITGLETRETYNYRIKAVNDAGYSDSIDLSFTTKDDYAWLIPIYHIILN